MAIEVHFVKQDLDGKFSLQRMVRSLSCSTDVMPSFGCVPGPVVAQPPAQSCPQTSCGSGSVSLNLQAHVAALDVAAPS
jgi:hypothetical protein